MSVYMRSNDVWLGAAYDFFQFTRVQLAICSILGIEPGGYAHHVGSLHLYVSNEDDVTKLKKTDSIEPIPYFSGSSWAEVSHSASRCLLSVDERSTCESLSETERWYSDAMISSVDKNSSR
jgi:thymidylate synthase